MPNDIQVDVILGGRGFGGIAQHLLANNMDTNSLRPWIGSDGRTYVTKNFGTIDKPKWESVVVQNASALLRRDQWLQIDETVVRAAKPRLQVVGDLRSRGLVKNIDGMSTPVLMYNMMSDITKATISMNGLREGEKDRPVLEPAFLPIPIIHKDLSFDLRSSLVANANGGLGFQLEDGTLEMAARRVAEEAEALLLGTTAYKYAGFPIWGYTNYPGRITKTLTNPTAPGWTPQTLFAEILDMRQSLRNKFRPGPYVMYTSTDWDVFLDDDYSAAYPGPSLRSRLTGINGIEQITSLDYLTGYQVLIVQMTSDVIREVVGMDVRTMQWTEKGGMELFFKVMAILVPQIRTDIDANAGIAHGVAP
jgi:hypothetical protein